MGEVTKPEAINYRTLKPEMNELLQRLDFGPVNDWECHLENTSFDIKRNNFMKGVVAKLSNLESTTSYGFIELASPATHVWYVKARLVKSHYY